MRLRINIMILFVATLVPENQAQVLTSQELLQQRNQWSNWVSEERKVQLTGRYEGRSASRVRLEKLKILFFPERGVVIPDRILVGTSLSMSGYFVDGNVKPKFRMTRLAIEPPDLDRLNDRLRRVPESNPEARYQLADQYEALAKFYMDRELQAAVDLCRTSTFDVQRRRRRNDAKALWRLLDPGPGFDVAENIQQHVRFQVFCLRAAAESASGLMKDLKCHLPGWKTVAHDIAAPLRAAFENDRVLTYGRANEAQRRQLERLFYRNIRLKELRRTLKPDGSNALTLSVKVADALPEETAVVFQLESTWADYRLKDVHRLKRRQLDELLSVLHRIERQDDVVSAANTWLRKQELVFRNRGSDGQLRLADDFLHASGKWNLPMHRERGIEYLKRAWTSASKESLDLASEIELRLAELGFTRLHNRWMTSADLENLLPGDIELAQREERVVRGMSLTQVETILGVPTRRVRMASIRYIEEIWIYGEREANRMLVRLQRPRMNPNYSATVTEVLQVGGF